jgi:hypothetical protein
LPSVSKKVASPKLSFVAKYVEKVAYIGIVLL